MGFAAGDLRGSLNWANGQSFNRSWFLVPGACLLTKALISGTGYHWGSVEGDRRQNARASAHAIRLLRGCGTSHLYESSTCMDDGNGKAMGLGLLIIVLTVCCRQGAMPSCGLPVREGAGDGWCYGSAPPDRAPVCSALSRGLPLSPKCAAMRGSSCDGCLSRRLVPLPP